MIYIKDKALFKLLAVQYLDDFKKIQKECQSNKKFIKLMDDLSKLGVKTIQLPEKFEYIVQRNIEIIVKTDDYDFANEIVNNINVQVNWGNINTELNAEFDKEIKFDNSIPNGTDRERQKQFKNEHIVSKWKAHFIEILLMDTWKVIERFYPLIKFGLPKQNLLEGIMNLLLNKQFTIERPSTHVNKNPDIHGLLQSYEIRYLYHIFKKHGIDIDREKIESGFYYNIDALKKLIVKNPIHNIIITPYVNKGQIIKEWNSLEVSLEKINKEVYGEISEMVSSFEKVEIDCWLYIDARFNRFLSGEKIYKELEERVKNLNLSEENISKEKKQRLWDLTKSGIHTNINRDISNLVKQIGLEDEYKQVLKRVKK